MEKKYPGTYKRHLVRPIVRSNAVEKLIKKKGSISHKPGMPPTKRSELYFNGAFLSLLFLLNVMQVIYVSSALEGHLYT